MANPNVTVQRARMAKYSCVAEQIFWTEEEARAWLLTQAGNRKVVRSFKLGPRRDPTIKYVARVYTTERD